VYVMVPAGRHKSRWCSASKCSNVFALLPDLVVLDGCSGPDHRGSCLLKSPRSRVFEFCGALERNDDSLVMEESEEGGLYMEKMKRGRVSDFREMQVMSGVANDMGVYESDGVCERIRMMLRMVSSWDVGHR
jgi:hypothetical protein